MEIHDEPKTGDVNIHQKIDALQLILHKPVMFIEVNNFCCGGKECKFASNKRKGKKQAEEQGTDDLREQILLYVKNLNGHVKDKWKAQYMKLWNGILDLEDVKARIYNPGKQQGTNFNRNLVANIIFYLGNQTREELLVYKKYNASLFAEKLEANKEHSVRAALGKYPPQEIMKSLDRFMKLFLLK
jgi:hypothetical protein